MRKINGRRLRKWKRYRRRERKYKREKHEQNEGGVEGKYRGERERGRDIVKGKVIK
jgi:hypothetical protein